MTRITKNLCFVVMSIVIAVFTMGAGMNEDSSDGRSGHNGSPGEQTCAKSNCHNTFALNSGDGEVAISSADMLNWTYQPGQTYQISLTVAQIGMPLFGFGFEALDEEGNNAGTLTPGNDNHALFAMVGGINRKTITHLENSGLVNDTKTWSFTWTAPENPVMVTFYAVGNAANNNGGRTGDYVYSASQVVMPASANVISPVISASGSLNLCAGESVNLSVSPQSGVLHQWYNNGLAWIQGDSIVVAESGCYSVQAIAFSDTVLSQNEVCVEVTDVNIEVIEVGGGLSASEEGDSYQWINCSAGNAPIDEAVDQTYFPMVSGNYAVEINTNGCVALSECIPFLSIGYDNREAGEDVVWRNSLTKELIVNTRGFRRIEIYDMSGFEVFSGFVFNTMQIDTARWTKGLYFVKLLSGEKCSASKVLIY
jgi:hypothetical protein